MRGQLEIAGVIVLVLIFGIWAYFSAPHSSSISPEANIFTHSSSNVDQFDDLTRVLSEINGGQGPSLEQNIAEINRMLQEIEQDLSEMNAGSETLSGSNAENNSAGNFTSDLNGIESDLQELEDLLNGMGG